MSRHKSVFLDEGVLDLNYVPLHLFHRNAEYRFLSNLFRFILDAPYEMSQRAVIVGGVGTGKTALAQRFGLNLMEDARRRKIKARYVHVNCRELRGSLFMILNRAVRIFRPQFPDRGYAANELLDTLMRILDEEDQQLILCLDEVDALIKKEGGEALYYLTRVQEERMEDPRRLSIIFISKNPDVFKTLDKSTLSTLQRNVIRMTEYTQLQLKDILVARSEQAFRPSTISPEIIDFISELATSEKGDARYAIDILWRAGKYADTAYAQEIIPEHVRKAASTIFPTLREEEIRQLSRHEKLVLLAIARYFKYSRESRANTGQVETSYYIICEEYNEKPRGHTQFWKYLNQLRLLDVVSMFVHASDKGRTQLISLSKIPAEDLEREVIRILEQV